MTNTNIQTTNNGNKAVVQSQKTTIQWLNDENFKKSLASVLPKHLTAERMIRIVLSELRNNQKLAQATPLSFISAVITTSQLGLEPGVLGKCYFIPYFNGKTRQTDVQYIIGYKGMIELARRSGEIKSVYACEVDEKDQFTYQLGLEPDIHHVPSMERTGNAIAYYAVAHFKDGGYQFDVMSIKEIEHARNSSKAKEAGPWMTHYGEMAKKTVLRRLFKWLPVSIELQTAISLDEQADIGQQQINELAFGVIDGESTEIDEISGELTEQKQEEIISSDGEVLKGTQSVLEKLVK